MIGARPLVSIVIVNWNGIEHTPTCLESLRRISYSDYEIIVVDNASTDGSRELVRDKFPEARLVESEANVGFGPGVMRAMPHVRGKYVLVLNNDLEMDPDCLDKLVDTAEGRPFAAVAGLILFRDRPRHVNGAGGDMSFLGHGWPRNYERPVAEVPTAATEVAFCAGGVTLYDRNAFEEVGGFDEDYFIYVEDADLSWRLRLAGYHICVEPRAVFRHDWDFSRNPRKLYHIERNRLLMLAKDYSVPALIVIAPALLVYEASLLVGSFFQGWGRLKLAAYRDAWRALPSARRKRRSVVRRVHEAEAARAFHGGMHHPEARNPLVRFVLNPFLGAYWWLARPVLRLVGARPSA
ncbi:MAG: glycosyltransferase family 2 protein [Candidatus Thermoplasmatota archaeon]